MTESAWIAHGVTNEEFEKYEDEVERFVATLQTMIAKLHDEGHLDVVGLAQFGRTLKEKPSP